MRIQRLRQFSRPIARPKAPQNNTGDVPKNASLTKSPPPSRVTRNSLVTDGTLNPRWQAWFYLTLSSIVALSSIAVAKPKHDRGPPERLAMSLCGLSAFFAFFMTFSFLYGPTRRRFTASLVETIVSVLVFVIWVLGLAVVMNSANHLAMNEWIVWNDNMFYATWTSFALVVYLVADLLTGEQGRLAPLDHRPRRTIRFLWVVLFISSVVLLAFGIFLSVGSLCKTDQKPVSCQNAAATPLMAGLSVLICLGAFFLLGCWKKENSGNNGPIRFGALLVSASVILNAGNVIISTSASGLGDNVGGIFVLSWVCFLISLILFLNYVNAFQTKISDFEPLPTDDLDSSGRTSKESSYAEVEEEKSTDESDDEEKNLHSRSSNSQIDIEKLPLTQSSSSRSMPTQSDIPRLTVVKDDVSTLDNRSAGGYLRDTGSSKRSLYQPKQIEIPHLYAKTNSSSDDEAGLQSKPSAIVLRENTHASSSGEDASKRSSTSGRKKSAYTSDDDAASKSRRRPKDAGGMVYRVTPSKSGENKDDTKNIKPVRDESSVKNTKSSRDVTNVESTKPRQTETKGNVSSTRKTEPSTKSSSSRRVVPNAKSSRAHKTEPNPKTSKTQTTEPHVKNPRAHGTDPSIKSTRSESASRSKRTHESKTVSKSRNIDAIEPNSKHTSAKINKRDTSGSSESNKKLTIGASSKEAQSDQSVELNTNRGLDPSAGGREGTAPHQRSDDEKPETGSQRRSNKIADDEASGLHYLKLPSIHNTDNNDGSSVVVGADANGELYLRQNSVHYDLIKGANHATLSVSSSEGESESIKTIHPEDDAGESRTSMPLHAPNGPNNFTNNNLWTGFGEQEALFKYNQGDMAGGHPSQASLPASDTQDMAAGNPYPYNRSQHSFDSMSSLSAPSKATSSQFNLSEISGRSALSFDDKSRLSAANRANDPDLRTLRRGSNSRSKGSGASNGKSKNSGGSSAKIKGTEGSFHRSFKASEESLNRSFRAITSSKKKSFGYGNTPAASNYGYVPPTFKPRGILKQTKISPPRSETSSPETIPGVSDSDISSDGPPTIYSGSQMTHDNIVTQPGHAGYSFNDDDSAESMTDYATSLNSFTDSKLGSVAESTNRSSSSESDGDNITVDDLVAAVLRRAEAMNPNKKAKQMSISRANQRSLRDRSVTSKSSSSRHHSRASSSFYGSYQGSTYSRRRSLTSVNSQYSDLDFSLDNSNSGGFAYGC